MKAHAAVHVNNNNNNMLQQQQQHAATLHRRHLSVEIKVRSYCCINSIISGLQSLKKASREGGTRGAGGIGGRRGAPKCGTHAPDASSHQCRLEKMFYSQQQQQLGQIKHNHSKNHNHNHRTVGRNSLDSLI